MTQHTTPATRATVRIGDRTLGPGHPAFLIAEIGINHNGSLELAKRLVDLSADAGADCVKFQMRDMKALYRQGDGSSAGEDLGPQYTLDLLSKFSLTNAELFEAFDHARARGVEVMCTPWDRPSVDALVGYGLPALKIASADLTNHDLVSYAAATGVPLILSTGMSSEEEIVETARLVRESGTPFVMLHCQSTYPAPFKDVNLRYMARIGELAACPVGYSGHERGFHVPLAAVALGAAILASALPDSSGRPAAPPAASPSAWATPRCAPAGRRTGWSPTSICSTSRPRSSTRRDGSPCSACCARYARTETSPWWCAATTSSR